MGKWGSRKRPILVLWRMWDKTATNDLVGLGINLGLKHVATGNRADGTILEDIYG